MSSGRVVIPLSKRPLDAVFAVAFVVMAFIAVFLDSANIFAPTFKDGKWGMTKEYAPTAVWPPQPFMDGIIWWCELADPLLCANPMWIKVMCVASPFVYAPFYLIAAYAFIAGKDWIRIPTLCVSTALFYSLTVILVDQVYGPFASHNLTLIFSAYTTYWLLPIVLFFKFAFNPHPFTVDAKKKRN